MFSHWVAKQMLLSVVNADTENKAFRALIRNTTEEKKGNSDLVPPNLHLRFPLLRKVLKQLREKHPLIEDMFLSGAGIDLQYIDSQITEKIIQHFTSIDIPVLPIHISNTCNSRSPICSSGGNP